MRPDRGITLIETMVIIVVIAVLLAIFLEAVRSARADGRRIQCANNMKNIGLTLISYSTSKNCFPSAGTFRDDPAVHKGDPLKSTIYRAITNPGARVDEADSWLWSWVIDVLPYFDNAGFYNAWNKKASYLDTVRWDPSGPGNAQLADVGIGVLRCPDDPTASPGHGNLSYVVNGGFARWHAVPVGWSGSPVDGKAASGAVLQWMPRDAKSEDNQAICKKLGVMFLGTNTRDQPWDIKTTPADIADGMSDTLLVAENTLAGYAKGTSYSGGHETNWACPLPNFAMFLGSDDVCRTARSATDCNGGQLRPGADGSDGKGWGRANQAGTFENINYGQHFTVEGSFPFANSGHPNGSNFVFCDGSLRFLSHTIDGGIYAQLITPAGTRLPPQFRQSQVTANQLDP